MIIQIEKKIAYVDFARPNVANSLNEAAWQELRSAFEGLNNNPDVHVIILSGAGKHFCSGMDLSVLNGLAGRIDPRSDDVAGQLSTFIRGIQDCITAIENCRQPVIAAVQGACIGGGVAIATACDIVYAAEDAYFVVKEVDFGVVPDIGTLQRLPRKIPIGLAAELSYTARKMEVVEAASAGLVTKRYPDKQALDEGTKKLAVSIAAKDKAVVAGIKTQLKFAAQHTIPEGLKAVADYSAKLMISRLDK